MRLHTIQPAEGSTKECKRLGDKILKDLEWDDSQESVQRAEVNALRVAIGEKKQFLGKKKRFQVEIIVDRTEVL